MTMAMSLAEFYGTRDAIADDPRSKSAREKRAKPARFGRILIKSVDR